MANADFERPRGTMTSEPAYQALFLGAGPHMTVRRRAIHPAAAGDGRKARTRQLHFVNPDAHRRLGRRHLARGRIGAKRGLQLPDRGLEARDVRGRCWRWRWRGCAAARRSDSARMGRAALAAPHHLYAGAAAGRYHRDVLAAGAARTRRRSRGRLDGAKMRAGAAAAEYRGARRNRRFETAAAACRRARRAAGW